MRRRRASVLYGLQESGSPVASDVGDSTESVGVSVRCPGKQVVKGSKVNPVAGFRSLSEFDSPPGSEGKTESSTVHSPDDFVKERCAVKEAVVEWFTHVLSDIASDVVGIVDRAYVDDLRIPGNLQPST